MFIQFVYLSILLIFREVRAAQTHGVVLACLGNNKQVTFKAQGTLYCFTYGNLVYRYN
jgi:hypothetical protein